MADSVLVPMDGSPKATAALTYALENFPGADITAIYVIERPEGYWASMAKGDLPGSEAAHEHAEGVLESGEEQASEHDREIETVIETGDAGNEIVEYAIDNDIDQIVMGSHGRSGVERVLFGSVSEKVVRNAPMTVVVVRDE